MPRVAMSSILTIRSPDLMPARKAGVSSIGEITRIDAVFDADLDAQAAELALRRDLQVLEGVGVEEIGMRVEPVHHPVDRLLDELVVRDRLDVVALDPAENGGQQLQILVRDRHLRSRCAIAEKLIDSRTPSTAPKPISPPSSSRSSLIPPAAARLAAQYTPAAVTRRNARENGVPYPSAKYTPDFGCQASRRRRNVPRRREATSLRSRRLRTRASRRTAACRPTGRLPDRRRCPRRRTGGRAMSRGSAALVGVKMLPRVPSRSRSRAAGARPLRYHFDFCNSVRIVSFVQKNWLLILVFVRFGRDARLAADPAAAVAGKDVGNLNATRLINSSNAVLLDVRETRNSKAGACPTRSTSRCRSSRAAAASSRSTRRGRSSPTAHRATAAAERRRAREDRVQRSTTCTAAFGWKDAGLPVG